MTRVELCNGGAMTGGEIAAGEQYSGSETDVLRVNRSPILYGFCTNTNFMNGASTHD